MKSRNSAKINLDFFSENSGDSNKKAPEIQVTVVEFSLKEQILLSTRFILIKKST